MTDQTDLCPTCHGTGRINVASSETRSTSMSHEPRKPPKELSERGLHTTETVADGSIANHEHVYRCQDCGEIGRGPADSPPQPDPNCLTCKDNWPYCSEHNYWLLEPTEEMKAVTAEIAQEVDDILDSPPPLQESERIRHAAMNIVNQLGDLWAIPVADRQQGNDKADDFTAALIAAETDRARAEGARAELERIIGEDEKPVQLKRPGASNEIFNDRIDTRNKFRAELRAALGKQEPKNGTS